MGYNETLNLPKTDFPMRAKLPEREPEFLERWEKEDIYRQVQEKNQGKPKFILHDGPPYANGNIHLGTTLNKILKDIIIKYHSMAGYDAPYTPGWDTHGLPIEQQAIKNLGLNRHEVSTVEFRQNCRDYALKYVDIQRGQFKRLGVRGDWDDPYLTLKPEFEAAQIGVFGEMARKGYIYKGLKPVYWCSDCQTALAEAEVEYQDSKSPSIYVKFAVKDGKGILPAESFVVIWTTTPWTLPANVAISLHPEYVYALLEVRGEKLVMAKELYQQALKDAGIEEEAKIIQEFKGSQLEGVVCSNPLVERDSLVILGFHVTLDAGTGCVHTAPGHGIDDYEVGMRYDLPVISPLDDNGNFTAEVPILEGMPYFKANKKVTEILEENGSLLHLDFFNHQYPHCWRCKHPVIFRATEQWFASIKAFRNELLEEVDRVNWIPSWGRDRMHNMIADRGDWCISRQRTWGVPIPVFYCSSCNQSIITPETISHIQKLFREHGSDVWFAREASELVPPGLTCSCGGKEFTKEKDIMDVWFDSGSSHMAVLQGHLSFPADMYLEGTDQYRGWFNSSLSTGVAVRGQSPYKTCLTHGFVVDEQGRKMSKSLGNTIDPLQVIKEMGADILRLWVSSADYHKDIAVSDNIMKQMTEAYRKIRNTCRFLLGNLYDFTPGVDDLAYEQLQELDKFALLKLQRLVQKVTDAYDKYEFHRVYHDVHNFCVADMSAFYLNIIKDRVYLSAPESEGRRAAQTVMYAILETLVKLLSPILAFTSEEIWTFMPKGQDMPGSVQLADWPVVNEKYIDTALESKWEKLIKVREQVVDALEVARSAKTIRDSLEARVDLYADQELFEFLKPMEEDLSSLLIVSQAVLNGPQVSIPEDAARESEDLAVKISIAEGEKCERCWMYSGYVGSNQEHPTLCKRCEDVVNQLA